MKRAESIESLLKRTHDELKKIVQSYRACADSPDNLVDIPDLLKIDIYDFLAHNKAILDYLAQEIASLCSPMPNRTYFPVASREKTVSEFQNDLNRWFPGLRASASELFDYLIDIQHFRDSPWLLEFNEITNFNKHNNLSPQRRSEFVSLKVHFRGVGPRVGELGFQSITIEPGAALRLRAANGEVRTIRGPQVIDINTTHLANADTDIVIDRIRWSDFKIDPSEHSTVGLLNIINLNVQRVCDKVSHLVAKYNSA